MIDKLLIPDGTNCFSIVSFSLNEEKVHVQLCPYLEINAEEEIKYCTYLKKEIISTKECNINSGVE